MSTSITNLEGSTPVTTAGAAAIINNNFDSLNDNKIETSYIDTDTTLAANSDSKIATQKAVKAYVDSGGNQNASETQRGIVEEATDSEVTAGTATGATGAKLFVTPAKLATRTTTVLAPYQLITVYKNGTTTKDMTAASGNQTIAHGVGKAPTYVRLSILLTTTSNTAIVFAVYNGTTQSAINARLDDDGTDGLTAATFVVYGSDSGTDTQTGVITVDATNITIAWTKTNSPTGTAVILWEAQA